MHSGKALDVQWGSQSDNAPLYQWGYAEAYSQQWSVKADAEGYYLFGVRNTGKLLHVANNNQTEGGSIVQLTANGTPAQQWRVEEATCSTNGAARAGAGIADLSRRGELPDGFRLWPNPARDHVLIDLRAADGQPAGITLTDPTGRVMHQVQVNSAAEPIYRLATDAFGTGLYFVSIKTTGKPVASLRLILTH